MKVCINDILYASSRALDCVEGQLIGVTTHHSERVAYMCVRMGKVLGVDDRTLLQLAAAAALHDNALTEYIQEELKQPTVKDNGESKFLGTHCLMGERNVAKLPFYQGLAGTVKYHHEKADGTGPFGKTAEETPLFARLIHLTDTLDKTFDFGDITEHRFKGVIDFLHAEIGKTFDRQVVELFLASLSFDDIQKMSGAKISSILRNCLPVMIRDYSNEEIGALSTLFARIIDYKSQVTSSHSAGVAEKSKQMAEYYHYDETERAKVFFAGALHDIGKLVVDSEILEKPDKLTAEEFKHVKYHALETYKILSGIKGFEEITSWSSLHHEKLDGSGYPFGKTAEELGQNERLIACVDIYQALVEKRAYKEGMSHEAAIHILQEMGAMGQLDREMIKDIDLCLKETS